MKTRRNRQSEYESLERLKEIRDVTQSNLRELLERMNQREKLKLHQTKLAQLSFETEALVHKGEKIPPELEESWKKEQIELGKILIVPKQTEQNKVDLRNYNENVNSNEQRAPSVKDEKSQRRKSKKENNEKISDRSEKSSSEKTQNSSVHKTRKEDQEKRGKNTKMQTISLKEEDDGYLKLRLRLNRANQLVIDRYVQKKDSFLPFDEEISKQIMSLQKYNEDLVCTNELEGNFDMFYNNYMKKTLNDYYYFSDEEEEETNFEEQLRDFQYSHKQFLKQKRGHSY